MNARRLVLTRRRFLEAIGSGFAALALASRPTLAGGSRQLVPNEHPEPRPGIDASRVVPADELPPRLIELFDQIREIPHVVDGIRCHCGCADRDQFYSLLSCYEEGGMAQRCRVCQDEGALVYRLHRDGRTLDEIRTAVDGRFA